MFSKPATWGKAVRLAGGCCDTLSGGKLSRLWEVSDKSESLVQ
jgi:hypothetical protein